MTDFETVSMNVITGIFAVSRDFLTSYGWDLIHIISKILIKNSVLNSPGTEL